jgi:hypothetical protein
VTDWPVIRGGLLKSDRVETARFLSTDLLVFNDDIYNQPRHHLRDLP